MSLFKEWEEELKDIKTKEQYEKFWKDYFPKEAECYRQVLITKNPLIEGNIKDLAKAADMTVKQYIGFLDGANSSFKEELELDSLTEDSEVKAELDFEKLLWNMHDAKADWLYGMEEWKNIFDDEKRTEIKKDYNRSKIVVKGPKVGRNDPCPCGSGKKYKKCCGKDL
jgi:preprotein translocase subunit SecA